jgi:DeoR family transcriptional regulator, copper-sensing transcriptional repressor
MLPSERQSQILSILKTKGTVTISELSYHFDVSEMTVYRDLRPLLDEKKVIKTSEGISLPPAQSTSSNVCTYCLKESSHRHPIQIITHDLRVEQLCCPHCGLLRYKDIQNEVSQIICRDFLLDITISAKFAYFLLDADFNLNCCQPQVLAFGSEKYARKFQTGFGGTLFSFQEAIEEINGRMNGRKSCGCKVKE